MRYCEYYCYRHHHSLVVKKQSETYLKQGSLLVQQKCSKLCIVLESLKILQLPPPLKWCSNIYPSFVSGSVQFFVFALIFFVSLLISSLWRGQWWGIFQLCCCCLFPAIVYSWNLSDQVRALRGGGALPSKRCVREASSVCTSMIDSSQTLLLALIGCIDPGAVDSCKSNYSHWVEPQTRDFFHSWSVYYSTVRS